jgi:hypothetical protein
MLKITTTLVAASLLCPASFAFAGEKAVEAGDRAEQSTSAKHQQSARNNLPGVKHARRAIQALQRADPGLTRFFDERGSGPEVRPRSAVPSDEISLHRSTGARSR